MKGIILAGGTGSRLHPATAAMSKQLLPVFDKPMIYYPLTTLMLAGIREFLVIATPEDLPRFRHLLGDGARWGLGIGYAGQAEPRGIAEGLMIGEAFLGGDSVGFALGDNLVFGHGLSSRLQRAAAELGGATIFAHPVDRPQDYGVVTLDGGGRVLNLVEKPTNPTSSLAVIGLYMYDGDVCRHARDLRPSERGELEITDVNRGYLGRGNIRCEVLGRGMAWLDAGTPYGLHEASSFVSVVERRQGLKIGCPEEVAWRMGFVDDDGLVAAAASLPAGTYREYVLSLPHRDVADASS